MPEFVLLSQRDLTDAEASASSYPVVKLERWENALEVNFTFPGIWMGDPEPDLDGGSEGFREIGLAGGGFLSESGKPLMPSFGRFVQIPNGVTYEVTVDTGEPVIFHDVRVTPAQENATDGEEDSGGFEYDARFYSLDTDYPEKVVEVSGPQDLDGYRVLLVHVRPLRYNPAKRELMGYGNVRVTFRFAAAKADDAAPTPFDPASSREAFGNLLLNPSRGGSLTGAGTLVPSSLVLRLLGPEYIIIYDPALKPAAERLATWKNHNGIITETVPINTVGNTPASIKQYVRGARQKFARLRYVLLFGDVASIVTEQRSGVTTDHYYYTKDDPTSDADCVLPWVSGGRIPTSTLDEANSIVDQIIRYEKNPPCDPEYYRRMTAAAYFQDDNNDGRADRAYMKTMEAIRTHMTALGFEVQRVYVSSMPNPTHYKDGSTVPAEVRNAIVDPGVATQMLISETSEGQLLIGHRDHGGPSGWVDPPFRKEHVQALTGSYPTVFYSVNCSTGRFDMPTSDSFAEDILECAGAAPTLVAATEDSGTWRNDSLIKGLFDAMWPGVIPTFPGSTASYAVRHNRIGDILNYGKSYLLVAHGTTSGVKHHFEIYHVVGDPTLQIWGSAPRPIGLSAKLARQALLIRLAAAPADCVVTIWRGDRLIKRVAPASSRISLPISDLKLEGVTRSSARLVLEVCAAAPGHRFAQTKVPVTM